MSERKGPAKQAPSTEKVVEKVSVPQPQSWKTVIVFIASEMFQPFSFGAFGVFVPAVFFGFKPLGLMGVPFVLGALEVRQGHMLRFVAYLYGSLLGYYLSGRHVPLGSDVQ